MSASERKARQRSRQRAEASKRHLNEFRSWLRFWGYSKTAVDNYAWTAQAFIRALGPLHRVTTADLIRAWPKNCAASTHNNIRARLVAYYRFLGVSAKESPAFDIELRRRGKRLPKPYDTGAQHAYLAAAKRMGPQHYALACLGVYGGLRVSEIALLRWSDVGDRLRVRGKGDKDRTVPVAAALRKALTEWRTACPSRTWVMPPKVGYHRFQDRPVTRGLLWLWHQDVLHEAGLVLPPGQRGLHRLRHTFATRAYEGTHDIMRVRKWMGHTNVNTTMLYTEVADDGDSDAIQQAFEER